MVDCWKYNLTENIRSCLVENWWQIPEFWVGIGIAIVIVAIIFYIYNEGES